MPQSLPSVQHNKELYSQGLRQLRRLCRDIASLPKSCTLRGGHITYMPTIVSSSAMSDVYRGQINGHNVALKSLRIHVDDYVKVMKVGRSFFGLVQRLK